MALTDLTDLDIVDLTLAKFLPQEKQDKMMDVYLESFGIILGRAVEKDLTDADREEMKQLMASPDVTSEKIEQYYRNRIPDFETKLALLALEFKKRFVIGVYQNKIEEYKNREDKYGLAAWEQVYYDAEHDNWNEVARLLKIIETMGNTPPGQTAIQQS